VAALKGHRIARVAGGWRHTMAVDDQGRCYAWGWGKVRGGVGGAQDGAQACRQQPNG
jgi:alpha-tubulin suppressor-like RCC1 family protein